MMRQIPTNSAKGTTNAAAMLRRFEIAPMGLRTIVREAGPADSAEAIVFLHGHPGSSRDWEPLLAQAGEIGRALAFDLPGFGEAEKPANWDYLVRRIWPLHRRNPRPAPGQARAPRHARPWGHGS